MHTTTTRMLRRAFSGLMSPLAIAGLAAAEPAPSSEGVVIDALKAGKISLHLRARWEHADQDGADASDALTLRTRLGYTTGAMHGFKVSAEFEDIRALDADAYNQAGLNPGGAGRTVIADPETTELNQAWIGYTHEKTEVRLGRQRLVLDNQRFVGDVGWRQNMQTFDAFSLQDRTFEHLTFTYAYLWQVNRVFGRDHPQGRWRSDSHLIHAAYAGLPGGTLRGYVHVLDFDNAAANGCATYGLGYAGSREMGGDFELSYRAEYAVQGDHGSSALAYRADYVLGEIGGTAGMLNGALGYEVLGTDNGAGFRTPLATLHAFNGWVDLFLTTPGSGLRDLYLKAGVVLPRGWSATLVHHRFETDRGATLGDEWDVLVSWKIDARWTALAKAAVFNSRSALPDVSKVWAQVEFAF